MGDMSKSCYGCARENGHEPECPGDVRVLPSVGFAELDKMKAKADAARSGFKLVYRGDSLVDIEPGPPKGAIAAECRGLHGISYWINQHACGCPPNGIFAGCVPGKGNERPSTAAEIKGVACGHHWTCATRSVHRVPNEPGTQPMKP